MAHDIKMHYSAKYRFIQSVSSLSLALAKAVLTNMETAVLNECSERIEHIVSLLQASKGKSDETS